MRGSKRKLVQEDETSSGEDEEEDDESVSKTPNGRNHALSPASSNHSLSTSEQVLRATSPKTRRTEIRPESSENATGVSASVKDIEQAMSKHLPGASLTKPDSPAMHQPTDFSTDALLKQQQQRSTIQWIGAHHHLGHPSSQQSSAPSLPASALLRHLYATNRESVIRANVQVTITIPIKNLLKSFMKF